MSVARLSARRAQRPARGEGGREAFDHERYSGDSDRVRLAEYSLAKYLESLQVR